jgi:hypothetical protein
VQQQPTRKDGAPQAPKAPPGVSGAKPEDGEGDAPRSDFNAGSATDVNKRQGEARARELRRIAGIKHLLESPEGRLWLWELLSFCGVSKTSFDGTSRTYFNEGARNVGLRITADLTRHFPEKYVQMLREEGGF